MPLTVTERYAAVSAGQTATTAFTPASDCTAGALVVLLAGANVNAKHIASVSDALGNTWTLGRNDNGLDGCASAIFFTLQDAARILHTTTVTVTWNVNTSCTVGIWLEETPGIAANPLDQASGNFEADPPIQTNLPAGSQAGDLIWICTTNGDASNFTPGTAYSQPTTGQQTLTASCKTAVEYVVDAGTLVPVPQGHWGGAGVDVESGVSFKAAASGPTDHLLSACGAGH